MIDGAGGGDGGDGGDDGHTGTGSYLYRYSTRFKIHYFNGGNGGKLLINLPGNGEICVCVCDPKTISELIDLCTQHTSSTRSTTD